MSIGLLKKYRKFQLFGAFGSGIRVFGTEITTRELGFTVGKLYKGKNHGFWDLSTGLSYFGRKIVTGANWFGTSSLKVSQTHTYGIPFEATFYASKIPVGVGIGIAGNLNLDQPCIGLLFRMRFGNPVLKIHSTLKRKHSSII